MSTAPTDPLAQFQAAAQNLATAYALQQGQLATAQQQVQQMQAAAATAAARARLGWLGCNDQINDYWGIVRWADAFRSASGFTFQSGTPAYSADGYPVGTAAINAQAFCWCNGCPAGDYVLTWGGDADVTVGVYGGSYRSTGPGTGVVTLPSPGTVGPNPYGPNNPNVIVTLTVTRSNPANPLSNCHLWLPGYGPGTARAAQVYRDEYLALWRNLCGARVMPSLNINNSAETTWSTRVLPTQWDWTSKGLPHEMQVALARAAGLRRLWICVPENATDDYLQSCARLYHDTLPPGVELTVEYVNECWNWGFTTRKDLFNDANAHPANFNGVPGAVQTTDPNILDARDVAERARHMATIFRTAYADRPGDLTCVFAGQATDPTWTDNALGWLAARYGGHPFDAIAITGYYDHWANNGYFCRPTGPNGAYVLDDVFGAIQRYLADNTPQGAGLTWQLAQASALCAKYAQGGGPLRLKIYEGGQSCGANVLADGRTIDPNGLSTLAQLDPRMGLAEATLYALMHKFGVEHNNSFALIGDPWSQFGYWSILRSFADDTPRWDAMQREALRSN